jgi:hypothetical protein
MSRESVTPYSGKGEWCLVRISAGTFDLDNVASFSSLLALMDYDLCSVTVLPTEGGTLLSPKRCFKYKQDDGQIQ